MAESGHSFDFDGVRVIADDGTKSGRLVKEAWLSGEGAINRHIDLRPAYTILRTWEAHHRTSRNKQLESLEPNPRPHRSCARNEDQRSETISPPTLAREIEIACQHNHQHVLPTLNGISDNSDTIPHQLSIDRCPDETAGTRQDRKKMNPLARPHRSPRPNGDPPLLPPLNKWEASTTKPPTVRTITNCRMEAQRTEEDSATIGRHPAPTWAKGKREKCQHDGMGRGASRCGNVVTLDGEQEGQATTPQYEIGTARGDDMQRSETISPSPLWTKGKLPCVSDKQGTPIFGKVPACSSMTTRPEGAYGCVDGEVEAARYRVRGNQSPHSYPRGTAPPMREVERTSRSPSPSLRVTRSRTVGQWIGSVTTGPRPAPKRINRNKHRLEETEGQTPRDMDVTPQKDQRNLWVEPQGDLGATTGKGKSNRVGVQAEGGEGKDERLICTRHLGKEEKRECLESGGEDTMSSIWKDRCEPTVCAKVNGITVIDRAGPVTRARSRAQALTQI